MTLMKTLLGAAGTLALTTAVASAEPADTFGPEWYARMAALSPEERLQRFSRKNHS